MLPSSNLHTLGERVNGREMKSLEIFRVLVMHTCMTHVNYFAPLLLLPSSYLCHCDGLDDMEMDKLR